MRTRRRDHPISRWKENSNSIRDSLVTGMAAKENRLKFPLLSKAMFRSATVLIKAQDKLTALGLDGRLANRIESSTILGQRKVQTMTSSTMFSFDTSWHTPGRGSLYIFRNTKQRRGTDSNQIALFECPHFMSYTGQGGCFLRSSRHSEIPWRVQTASAIKPHEAGALG